MLKSTPLKRVIIIVAAIYALTMSSQMAQAMILHPDSEPNLATWTDRPHTAITGRWGTNASCIAIAPNYIITTTHQGGGTSTPVVIDGVTYSIDKIFDYPTIPNPADPNHVKVDLRLVKLKSANLEHYADIYTMKNEKFVGSYAILTGFGLARDGELKTNGITYGYKWQNRSTYKNYTQRYATNKIKDAVTNLNLPKPYKFEILIAYFDRPSNTIYEGTVAEFDSGGGWFIKSSGQWKLAALNWGTSFHKNPDGSTSSWFKDPENPANNLPDSVIGLRLSTYAMWIMNTIEKVCEQYPDEDFNGDCIIGPEDLAHLMHRWLSTDCDEGNNYCQHADLLRDSQVNNKDFAKLASQWQNI